MDSKASDTTHPTFDLHAVESTPTEACVQVVFSPDRAWIGARWRLSDSRLLLGRDLQDNGLRLSDSRLSRVHARLTFDARAGSYWIGDAQSRNGTFVNTRRIESVLLSSGDVIRAGDTLLVFGAGDPMKRLRAQAAATAETALPLRERKTEVIALALAFARELGWELELHADAAEALLCWHWPFDLRELRSLIRTCFTQSSGGALDLDRLHEAFPEIVRPLIERRSRSNSHPAHSG